MSRGRDEQDEDSRQYIYRKTAKRRYLAYREEMMGYAYRSRQ
jgi:hypothetical protein